MIVSICIGNAAAPWSDVIQTARVQGLQKGQDRARLRGLLRVDQLLRRSELTGGDEVLNSCDHHGNDGERLGCAGGFRDHPDLHDLSFDLIEARDQIGPASLCRYQNSGWPDKWIYDVAYAQVELL